MEKPEVVEGKVDWKGRAALKHKHGGIRAATLVQGNGKYVLALKLFKARRITAEVVKDAAVAFGMENMATVSLACTLATYFNSFMHFEIADAANQLTNFMGSCYILSIVVAALADTCIGRYKAVVISMCLEFLGLALLTLQAHYPQLHPPVCNVFDATSHCEKVRGGDAALLFTALYLLAAGSAGVKAGLPAHGADQFDEKDPEEAGQMSSFFNFLLMAICTGGTISLTLIIWVQQNKGWDWGFGLSSISMFLAMIVFTGGLPMYRIHVTKRANALVEIIQVYVAAIRNRNLMLPENASDLYEIDMDKESGAEDEFLPHQDTFRFLDRAAIQIPDLPMMHRTLEAPSPWKLCRVTQVETAKIVLGMFPIFSCTIIMTLCLAQLQTFSIQQGLTMDARLSPSFKIPPASLPIIPFTFLIVIVPVYDRIIVPFLRRITGNPTGITHLQRIGVGLILSSVSMAVASAVEVKRKGVARDHGLLDAIPVAQPLPVSIFWLSFQYFIFGIADMFTYVGLLEFFYSEAPKSLKSVSTCFLWSSMALGYFFSTILVKVVNVATRDVTRSGGWLAGNNINRNHLNLFYLLLSLLSLINFFVYLVFSRRYNYRPQIHRPVTGN
ncbi:hypothetical protein MLD38_039949 [Melastoma candidum]|uniref:Uncharacterized protein n=1 Tax=Melastoma candidum TaxID=119954 RepID=A0ACB9L4G5_9MYRT|nr:hypothetical protein MLD38_039949 [Melastoma candidum]